MNRAGYDSPPAADEAGPDAPGRPLWRSGWRQYPVTAALLAVLAAVWLVMTVVGGSFDATRSGILLTKWGAARRPELWLWHQYWRLFTANFLHIGVEHLAMNAVSLWSVGRVVESFYGPTRTLAVYLFAGVAGATASAVLGPPIILSAGASGAIFGLLGAVIWYRVSSPLGRLIAWKPLLLTLGLNLLAGLALYRFVDNWNHLGGLAGGLAAAATLGVSAVPGMEPPRFRLSESVRGVLAGILLLGALTVVGGGVELPGRGRDLARAYLDLRAGRLALAETGFRRAALQQPDDPDLRYWLAETYNRQHKCREAEEQFRLLVGLAPDYPGLDRLSAGLGRCSQ